MRDEWLSKIIGDGTLKDNSSYEIKDLIFKNTYSKKDLYKLYQQKGVSNPVKKNDKVFNFLHHISDSELLIKENLVLFNEYQYQHNSDDSLIRVSGNRFQSFSINTGNLIGYVKKGDYSLKITVIRLIANIKNKVSLF